MKAYKFILKVKKFHLPAVYRFSTREGTTFFLRKFSLDHCTTQQLLQSHLRLKYDYIIEAISLKCLNVLNISKMIKIIKAKWFQRSY